MNYTIPLNRIRQVFLQFSQVLIIINGNSRIGRNCRVQTGVTLASTDGNNDIPVIGDKVFLGDGCKVIWKIRIDEGVQIGANAVVVKDIESGII